MSLKRVRDTDLEFDAAFERLLSTSRTQNGDSYTAQRQSPTLSTENAAINGAEDVTQAVGDAQALEEHTTSKDTNVTNEKPQASQHEALPAVTRQPSEPLSVTREDSETSNSNAGPSRASSLQRETPSRQAPPSTGRLGSAHPALDVWARLSQAHSLKGKQRVASGSSDHDYDNDSGQLHRSGSRGSLPPYQSYTQASGSVLPNGHHASSYTPYYAPQYDVRPKKSKYPPLLDENGNEIRRKVGRPRTKPLPPLDEFGNVIRRKVGRPRLKPADERDSRPAFSNPRVNRKPDSDWDSEKLFGYPQVKTEPEDDFVLPAREEPEPELETEGLMCLPIEAEQGTPNRAETHTLFVDKAQRTTWILRQATLHTDQESQSSIDASALTWVRWTAALGYPEFAPELGFNVSATANGNAPETSPNSKLELRTRLFPISGQEAYRALLKSHFIAQRTPRDRLSVTRLLTSLRKHSTSTPAQEATEGETSVEQKVAPKRKLQPEKIARKAFRQRRPTPLDARHLWTVWAKKAHAAQSPRKNVAFPLLEDSASEARQGLLRTSPPPSSADGEPPSPSKMLRFSMPQEAQEEVAVEEPPPRVTDDVKQLPFLRRNLRIYAKLGYSVSQSLSEEHKQ